jgi:hypothetical protein
MRPALDHLAGDARPAPGGIVALRFGDTARIERGAGRLVWLILPAGPNVTDWGLQPARAHAVRPPPATPKTPPCAVPDATVIAATHTISTARDDCPAAWPSSRDKSPAAWPATGDKCPTTRPTTRDKAGQLDIGRRGIERVRVDRKGKDQIIVGHREHDGDRQEKIPIPTHMQVSPIWMHPHAPHNSLSRQNWPSLGQAPLERALVFNVDLISFRRCCAQVIQEGCLRSAVCTRIDDPPNRLAPLTGWA